MALHVRFLAALLALLPAVIVGGMQRDVDDQPSLAFPSAADNLRELFQWPEQLIQRALTHPLGHMLEANLRDSFAKGIAVVADFSGFGSPEIALGSIGRALNAPHEKLTSWRQTSFLPGDRCSWLGQLIVGLYMFWGIC